MNCPKEGVWRMGIFEFLQVFLMVLALVVVSLID